MYGLVFPTKMVSDIVYLGMAVMAAGYTVISTCTYYLVELDFTVGSALFSVTRLEKTTTTTTTIII